MIYEEQLTDYFAIITRKFHHDKISEDKYGRLAEKIEEWADEMERKEAE